MPQGVNALSVDLGSPTPYDWELQWTDGELFGFRGLVELFQNGVATTLPADAFDVSEMRWFRLEHVFSL